MGNGSGWGSGWGGGGAGSGPPGPPNTFVSPLYRAPAGQMLGQVHSSRFTGEPESGLLSGNLGAIFFSPSLLQQNSTNEIDLDWIEVAAKSVDPYIRPPERDGRLFRFGLGGSRTNDPERRGQPKTYAVTAILVQTMPAGPTTVVKIP